MDFDRKRRLNYFLTDTEEEPQFPNALTNGSFDNGTTDWSILSTDTIAITQDADPSIPAELGDNCLRVTAAGGNRMTLQRPTAARVPVQPEWIGQYATMYSWIKWLTGTPLTIQMNVQRYDAGGALLQTYAGDQRVVTTTEYTRLQNNDNLIVDGTAFLSVLCRTPSNPLSVAGDQYSVAGVYLVIGDNIIDTGPHPPYEPHPND